ncbi:MAG TPA: FAD-binding protein [Burkholderiales bacterium]|nr:FAD-binding protein [Burkholderiales bacterium]
MAANPNAPLSAHELRDAVRHGYAYDIGRLDRVLCTDETQGLLEVQAGTRWAAIARHMRPEDQAAAQLGDALPRVGTSVAWNAAGPDGRPAVAHVESLTLVTPDGELRRASRTSNADLFALAVGGQDLFGPLYSVTLRIESLSRALAEAATAQVEGTQPGDATRRLQLLVPPESLVAFLDDLRAACDDWRIRVARRELRETRHESETFLPWARRSYVQASLWLAVPQALGGAVRLAQACGELIDRCMAHGGSFSIAQTLDASREQVEACYPGIRSFLAEKRRVDPSEKMVNGWYRHYRGLLGRQRCESRWNN